MRFNSRRLATLSAAALAVAVAQAGVFGDMQPIYNPVVVVAGQVGAATNSNQASATKLVEYGAATLGGSDWGLGLYAGTTVSSSSFNDTTSTGNALNTTRTVRYQGYLTNNPAMNDAAAAGAGSNSGYLFNVGYNSNVNQGAVNNSNTALAFGRSIGATSVTPAGIGTATIALVSPQNASGIIAGGFVSGAAGDNTGTEFWTCGSGGSGNTGSVHYLDASPINNQVTTLGNAREGIDIRGGQLFVCNDSAINAVGSGTPTSTGNTGVALPGLVNQQTGGAFHEFVFINDPANSVDVVTNVGAYGFDTAYVTNSPASATGFLGVQKFIWNGSSWVYQYLIPVTNGARGLAGELIQSPDDSSYHVLLWTTEYSTSGSSTSTTRLYQVDDLVGTTGPGGATTGGNYIKLLATSSPGQTFEGVALAPAPEPTSLALLGLGAAGLLLRRRK